MDATQETFITIQQLTNGCGLSQKKSPAPEGAELSLREGAGVSAGIHTSIYIILTKLLPVKPRLPRIDAGGLGPISVYPRFRQKSPLAGRSRGAGQSVSYNGDVGQNGPSLKL